MPNLGSYWFSKTCVWGLTVSCALLGLAGVIGTFTPDGEFLGLDRVGWCVCAFALVMFFSILGVIVMAAAVTHATARPGGWKAWHWPTLIPATLSLLIFAVASNIGMELGWDVLSATTATRVALPNESLVHLIFLLLSCAKPLSMLAICGREAMDQSRLDEEKRSEQDRVDRAADLDREHRHKERLARIAGKNLTHRDVGSNTTTSARSMSKSEKPTFPLEVRTQAVALLRQGCPPKEVEKITGIPYSTLKRQAWELKKGKVPRFAR